MKQLIIYALLLPLIFLTGCTVNNKEATGAENKYYELVISEIEENKLVVYKDLKDPTAEYPSYIININKSTTVIVDGKKGSLKDLKQNQIAQIFLKDGVLEGKKEMTAIKIKVIK